MAKFYVESGTVQMVTEAEDSRGAALWAVHQCMDQVLPLCPEDPLTPEEKQGKIDQRGCYVLDQQIRVDERGFGRQDAERFATSELFVEWNQLMTAMAALQRDLQSAA